MHNAFALFTNWCRIHLFIYDIIRSNRVNHACIDGTVWILKSEKLGTAGMQGVLFFSESQSVQIFRSVCWSLVVSTSFFQLSSQPYRRLERRFGPAAKPQNHYRMGQNPEFRGSFFRQKFCGSFIFWTFAILLHPLLSLVCHHYLVWNSNERILICVDSEALRSCVLPSVAKGTQLSLPNESNNTI